MIRTLIVVAKAQQIATVLNPQEPPTLMNYDSTNSVWVGDSNSAGPNDSSSVELKALTPLTLGQSKGTKGDIWIATASNIPSVKVGITPTGTQWAPSPADIIGVLVTSTLPH